VQVERMRVALRAVADDTNFFGLDQGEIGVFIVIDFNVFLLFEMREKVEAGREG
jgi:hypothetical protein